MEKVDQMIRIMTRIIKLRGGSLQREYDVSDIRIILRKTISIPNPSKVTQVEELREY